MTGSRRLLGWVLAIATTLSIAWLSRSPWNATEPGRASLRLSWRAVAESVHACRPPTEAEIAAVPLHMRPTEVCDRTRVPYRLALWLDDESMIDETVRAAGAREDRPTYVYRELQLDPGTYQLRVEYSPEPVDGAGAPAVAFESTIRLAENDALLITRRGDQFVILGGS